jgi:hypothetical protein
MRGAIPPLAQYSFMAWCSVKKAQGQLGLTFTFKDISPTNKVKRSLRRPKRKGKDNIKINVK